MIHILHLSDLHIRTKEQADQYRFQLATDLWFALGIRQLDYLVISGDITHYSIPSEYQAAVSLVSLLAKRFKLDRSRVIVVPGNHDLNWHLAVSAYKPVLFGSLPPGHQGHIVAGNATALLCDLELHRQRFRNFSEHFYEKVTDKGPYPVDYAWQGVLHLYPQDQLGFLALNSAWEIDHEHPDNAGINFHALCEACDQLMGDDYNGWLKIAVWHHPVTGPEAMNNEFMDQLTQHGFQICVHGHIHEAIKGYHRLFDEAGLRIIGAGTFGAPLRDQKGIPLQYNLLVLDPPAGKVIVHSRRKEKPEGVWFADARWGSQNDPQAWYEIELRPETFSENTDS